MFLHVLVLLWRFNSATWLASVHRLSGRCALTFCIIISYFVNGSISLDRVQLTVMLGVSMFWRVIRFAT